MKKGPALLDASVERERALDSQRVTASNGKVSKTVSISSLPAAGWVLRAGKSHRAGEAFPASDMATRNDRRGFRRPPVGFTFWITILGEARGIAAQFIDENYCPGSIYKHSVKDVLWTDCWVFSPSDMRSLLFYV